MKKLAMLTAPFVQEMIQATTNMYRLGWDERNGGNITYLLEEAQVLPFIDPTKVLRTLPLPFDAQELAGRYFLVTGSGKYFKNVQAEPEENLGLIRVTGDGHAIDILWGLSPDAVPTS